MAASGLTKARGGLYALGTVGTLGVVATIAAGLGWVEYDPQTRLVTITFTVDAAAALAPTVATFISAPLAAPAVWLGWGRK